MAKYLRILPSSQTTTTNGAILLDPNIVLYATATANDSLTITVNNLDTNADTLTITFSANDAGRRIQRQFMEAVCLAACDIKGGTFVDLQPLIDSTGTVRTITSFTYA